jgi:hypothetical protein
MSICEICGIPSDAGFFDESKIILLKKPDPANPGQEISNFTPGQELVLARYQLHRNYCGVLMSFAQFTDLSVGSTPQFTTPGYQWQIRCNGQPRDPYLTFDHIINPWGYGGFPVQLRLEEGCTIELVIRNIDANDPNTLRQAGGRITGRYWYNSIYGSVSNPAGAAVGRMR